MMNVKPFFGAASALLALGAVAGPTLAQPTSIGFAGALPDLKGVDLETRHVYDYTFSTAPTDWKIASGVWEMTNRWSCSPGWSWFGGRSDEVAAIWNKRKLAGDQSAQMYFAFKMGMSGVSSWPEYPADAALTICGDGKSLSTGYTFIAGANDNTRSILMKNGEVVASSSAPEAVLPRLTDGNPGNDAMVLSYDDPAPLKGGQTAVWTLNNGLMLARVQLYYQNEIRPVYVKQLAPAKPSNSNPSIKTAGKPPVKLALRPVEKR
jgi:hypothetical protein